MQIVQVDLENVKSYERESVRFTPGTNAICGYNGAGKSTILEAIGFALFDSLAVNQDEFVREGEKTASVTVHVAGEDGRPFQVVRKCGSYSQYYVYDPEIDQKLADGKADTMGWLHEFTGVELGGDLSALFKDAVGVPQGLLTAAFLETPSQRKGVFDPLLRVDEYEDVWEGLREPARCLKEDIADEKERIAGLEGEVKALPTERGKAEKLRAEIAQDEVARDETKAELDEVIEQEKEMAAVKERLDDLRQAVAEAEGDVKTRKAQWQDAKEALQRAEEAQKVVSETAEGHEAYLATQERLDELEEEREERDRLKEARQERDKALALANQQVERLKAELEDIAVAEETRDQLKPKVELQDALEEQLDKARRETERLKDRQGSLEERQSQLSGLEHQLVQVQEGRKESTEVEDAIEGLKRDIEDVEKDRDDLTSKVAACKANLTRVREQTEALASTEEATCPVCEGPLTPEHRSELLARNQKLEGELEEERGALEARRDELEEKRQQLQERLEERQARLKVLPREEEARKLSERIGEGQEAIAALEEEVAKLNEAPARVEQFEDDLEALGDPRHAFRRAVDEAAKRESVEKELGEAEENVVQLSGRLAALGEELAEYDKLDEQIEAQRQARDTHAPDHERYVAHSREAEDLEDRRERVGEQEEALATAQAECERLIEERDEVAAGYDAETHEELKDSSAQLREAIAELMGGLRQQREQLEQAEETIARLMEVEAELERARAQREELEELLSLMETLRQVVREAGPKVTQALVKVISAEAARHYADIMAERGGRLGWTEDYQIILRSDGRERGFQQLSRRRADGGRPGGAPGAAEGGVGHRSGLLR